MTRIRAECPDCGDVRLTTEQVVVRVCADDGSATYCFRCPSCRAAVAHDATPRVVALLDEAGVPTEVWHWPAEALECHHGPPFTLDDLLDFHELLRGDAWQEALGNLR